ncbi:MAG: hypothetical protein MUF04_11495 [Akkermansiaceae bacterium]|nr:hypothetical protein [Akkermansiaceae bacterium]
MACFLLGGALVFVMDRIPASRESGTRVDPPPPAQTRSDPRPPDPGEASRRVAIRREKIRKMLNSEDWAKKWEFVEGLQSAEVLEWYPSPEARADLLIQATRGDVDQAFERFSEPGRA